MITRSHAISFAEKPSKEKPNCFPYTSVSKTALMKWKIMTTTLVDISLATTIFHLLVPVTIALCTVLLVKSIPMNQAMSIPYRKENEQSCIPSPKPSCIVRGPYISMYSSFKLVVSISAHIRIIIAEVIMAIISSVRVVTTANSRGCRVFPTSP